MEDNVTQIIPSIYYNAQKDDGTYSMAISGLDRKQMEEIRLMVVAWRGIIDNDAVGAMDDIVRQRQMTAIKAIMHKASAEQLQPMVVEMTHKLSDAFELGVSTGLDIANETFGYGK